MRFSSINSPLSAKLTPSGLNMEGLYQLKCLSRSTVRKVVEAKIPTTSNCEFDQDCLDLICPVAGSFRSPRYVAVNRKILKVLAAVLSIIGDC